MHLNFNPNSYRALFAAAVILAVCSIFIYADIFNEHRFLHWDDTPYVLTNPHLQSLSLENLWWMLTDFDMANWHPVTWLSYALNLNLWGTGATSFKAVNLLFHVLSGIVLFILFRLVLQLHNHQDMRTPTLADRDVFMVALIGALLFVVHPLHVESVAWISERKDVLCAFFYFLGLYFYLQHKTSPGRSSSPHLVCFVLALMSKPMAITFPFVLMLLDIYPLKTLSLAGIKNHVFSATLEALHGKKLMIFISICIAAITMLTQSEQIHTLEQTQFSSRIITTALGIAYYVFSTLLPLQVSPYHPSNPALFQSNLVFIASAVGLLLFVVGLAYCLKKEKQATLVAILFFLISIAPVIGIVKVGHALFADRYTYIPAASLHLLTAWFLWRMLAATQARRYLNAALLLLLLSYIGLLSAASKSEVYHWKNDKTLWSRVISIYPNTADVAYYSLGNYYMANGKISKAVDNYRQGLKIVPNHIAILSTLAKLHLKQNKPDQAKHYIEQMLELNSNSARAHSLAADFFYQQKQYTRAEELYTRGLTLDHLYVPAIFGQAVMDYSKKQLPQAKTRLEYAIQLEPGHLPSLQLATQIAVDQGDYEKARHFIAIIQQRYPNDKFARDATNYLLSFTTPENQ